MRRRHAEEMIEGVWYEDRARFDFCWTCQSACALKFNSDKCFCKQLQRSVRKFGSCTQYRKSDVRMQGD